MPTYEYMCDECELLMEVIKPMSESARAENCGTCGRQGRRLFSSKVQFAGTAVQHAEYNPAFGKVVNNKYHRGELAKKHGMVEVGNEKPDTINKHFDDGRAEKRRKSWESA